MHLSRNSGPEIAVTGCGACTGRCLLLSELRDSVFSVIQGYCIAEADRVAARPRARRLQLEERKPRVES
jgi:hypothetical protein